MKPLHIGLLLAAISPQTFAQVDLASMSLEDLTRLEVTTVSRKVQRLADTSAAVSIVTAEDIARSGARSIPEALRHLPGVQVAQIGPSQWAVSVRGFNGRFSNKLLVQVDGRTVYTPFFAGVFWEGQYGLMENIERIEVVRGPGASLWGANAVNGVINIVTRRTATTLGTLAWVEVDDEGRLQAAARQGFGEADGLSGRVFARSIGNSELEDAGGEGMDNAQHGWSAGFRADLPSGPASGWSLQGNVMRLEAPETLLFVNVPATFGFATDLDFNYEMGNLMLAGNWAVGAGEAELRAYVDHLSADITDEAKGVINTVDVDFQLRLDPFDQHEVIWGLGARYFTYDLRPAPPVLTFDDEEGTEHVLSAFVQDEIVLQPKRWKLTLGTRVEHHSLAGTNWQPNVRLLWTPSDRDSVWSHVSRASRTPSVGEQVGRIIYGLAPVPPQFQPPACAQVGGCSAAVVSRISPEQDLEAEDLTAVELGYRRQVGAGSVEAVAFRHQYSNLLTNDFGNFSVPGSVGFPVIADQFVDRVNGAKARVVGLELGFDMPVSPTLRLSGAYSAQNLTLYNQGNASSASSGNEAEATLPHQMASLRASADIAEGHDLDLMWRVVGSLGTSRFGDRIPGYQALDLNYRWRVAKGFDVSLYVQNLFDDGHAEFASDFFPAPLGYVPRRAFLKGTLRF
ncbi:MAG: TonB-dependent receptor [Rhodocyclaceae bacterium]|nr:TonB-dependent receptor [Rhodocyclaceae bacterium]